jgi:ribosomal protein L23
MSILSFAKKLTQRDISPKTGKTRAARAPEKKAQDGGAPLPTILLDLTPVVTEKSVRLQEDGFVVFRVPHTVTKNEVVEAIQTRFKVTPTMIRMVRGRGKQRRRGQTYGQTAQWKKVYVKVDDVTALTTSS